MNGDAPSEDALVAAILDLCDIRGPEKTICPSEAAKRLANGEERWRDLMPAVRVAAAALARDGRIEICQGGEVVGPGEVKGPIRLRIREERDGVRSAKS